MFRNQFDRNILWTTKCFSNDTDNKKKNIYKNSCRICKYKITPRLFFWILYFYLQKKIFLFGRNWQISFINLIMKLEIYVIKFSNKYLLNMFWWTSKKNNHGHVFLLFSLVFYFASQNYGWISRSGVYCSTKGC